VKTFPIFDFRLPIEINTTKLESAIGNGQLAILKKRA